jgi:hypothetical protein
MTLSHRRVPAFAAGQRTAFPNNTLRHSDFPQETSVSAYTTQSNHGTMIRIVSLLFFMDMPVIQLLRLIYFQTCTATPSHTCCDYFSHF